MVFNEKDPVYAVEVERKNEEDILSINFMGAPLIPSIADSPEVMARTIDALTENPGASKVVFVQQRNYHYGYDQVKLLGEIARIYNYLTKHEDVLSAQKLAVFGGTEEIRGDLVYLIGLIRQDPISAYIEIKSRVKAIREQLDNQTGEKSPYLGYVRFLERFQALLEDTKLIQKVSGKLKGYEVGDRELYRGIFRPDILPNFTFTRLVAKLPENSELADQYSFEVDGEEVAVTILKQRNDSKYFYHLMPPEYNLKEEHYYLVNLARNVLAEHRPKAEEFTDPERTRNVFFNVAKDLLSDLSRSQNISLSHREIDKLSRVLVRHTIGFGLIEILLADPKLQDIVLNAPVSQSPVFVRHGEFEECVTNVIPSYEDADSWAAKLRLQSGRPLDEANPVLDTDLEFGNTRARVAAVSKPLSPQGLSFALRRHRDDPWTLPLFINTGMVNSFAAGLLSFIISGNRTMLVAGTRSAGKTSLLGSLMLEILPKYRTIVVEDTLELPVGAMKRLGYDILRMKVRSALVSGTTEVEASEGIRTSLRLGDSALIVGEVRSDEAKALYEAMRVGALANVVAGTIHGDSPYGIFDRVVNDLEVPATSFKATDIIIIANPIKTADGLRSKRRVVSVTEVRKQWDKDPAQEGGFVDLLRYNVETDELEPTEALINGDSEIIKSIASNVKGWAGDWDAVFDNIILRGNIKQEIVTAAKKLEKPGLMEAEFATLANNEFYRISEEVRESEGLPKSEIVFPKWKTWLYSEAEKF